jgi:hypothetical protein
MQRTVPTIAKPVTGRGPASAAGAARNAAPQPSGKWAAKLSATLPDNAAAAPRPSRTGNHASAKPPADEWEEF